MSDFQDGFFKDLWHDMLLNETNSVLCRYFREEKTQHILVKLKKYCYGLTVSFGASGNSLDFLKEAPELKKQKKQIEQFLAQNPSDEACLSFLRRLFSELTFGKEKEKQSRKGMGEHACVEILCHYYDFLMEYPLLCSDGNSEHLLKYMTAFLEDLRQKTDDAKVSKRRKKQALEDISRCLWWLKEDMEGLFKSGIVETAVNKVMDLYLYADAAQFLYNAGYPLPREDNSEEYGKEILQPKKMNNVRIKTVPLKLLDYYFSIRGFEFDNLSSVSRMSPLWVSSNEMLKEKLETVYDFACDNNLTKAVIPLLIDNASGSGLYIIGENYLQSWDMEGQSWQKVEEILDGRPCCYAIVKFLNLELEEDGQYFWAPYSVVDPVYGKCDINPEGILFTNLETALNIYKGQLHVTSQELLYENFRSENIVHLREDAVTIDPEFRKYFAISDEADDISCEKNNFEVEYRKRFSLEFAKR